MRHIGADDGNAEVEDNGEVDANAEADDQRSERAQEVHGSLCEGLSPEDEGFGPAVSANARDEERNGPPDFAGARGRNNGESTDASEGLTDAEPDTGGGTTNGD